MLKLSDPDKPSSVITDFCHGVALAKMALNDATNPKVIVIKDYLEALKEILTPAIGEVAWAAFMSRMQAKLQRPHHGVGTAFVLVVLPCTYIGVPWTEEQLRNGDYLACIPYHADQTIYKEPLYSAIPQAVWQAGRIDLPTTDDLTTIVPALLNAARERIRVAGNLQNL
ncbi:MAG: hypothetical protein HY817_02500 [Candidatus Abawacabacteria bacterium]|nr:hypothetical protein [Candidatus Abawacabacteria bacterium]